MILKFKKKDSGFSLIEMLFYVALGYSWAKKVKGNKQQHSSDGYGGCYDDGFLHVRHCFFVLRILPVATGALAVFSTVLTPTTVVSAIVGTVYFI